jgi:lipid A ethanolaminephosphotransferase
MTKSAPSSQARSRWPPHRPELHLLLFLLLAGGTITVLFLRPLVKIAAAELDLGAATGWYTLSTLLGVQWLLTTGALATAALVSTGTCRVLASLLFAGNAVALYFMDTYGVVLDRSMMGNVFATNTREVASLLHPRMLLYIAMLGVVPSVLVYWPRLRPVSWLRRAAFVGFLVVATLGWLYANSSSWLWLDKNASRLGAVMLPWSYIVNSTRHGLDVRRASLPQALLPQARVLDPRPVVVVLVIGESARAANFSLYGYGRATNPELTSAGVAVLPNASACATYTTQALRCILSHRGAGTPSSDRSEPLPSYLEHNGIQVTWRSGNSGEPRMHVARYEGPGELRKLCMGGACRAGYDELLVQGLAETIHDPGARKKLIVLHQAGSHGPEYFARYPPEFEIFQPVCRTVDLSLCTHQELVNAYDNTILYTDHLLGRVIAALASQPDSRSVMLYVSDHGESLGEYGLYLHGTPAALAPAVQKEIPFLVWTSPAFARGRAPLQLRSAYSQDFVFHSVLGALGIGGPVYEREFDLFAFSAPSVR